MSLTVVGTQRVAPFKTGDPGSAGGGASRGLASGRYVPELDGVRAIGMVSVLIYHAQLGVSGSFLAVSQFFTLSGFLIMTIILRSVTADGNINVSSFLGRRYRRLLPGSMLTLAGVVVFGATVASEQQLNVLPGQIISALAQVANWHFVVTDASYVELFQSPSPVQHFWSLAIEEQFYLFVAVLVFALMKVTGSLRVLTLALIGLTVASVGWTIYLFHAGATIDRMYYGTDTRASEILIGCVAALVLFQRPPQVGERGQRALGGVAVIAFSATILAFLTLRLTDRVIYQGGLPIMAVTTVVLVASLVHGRGPMNPILSFRPICELGRLTYGIYLFHWPIFLYLTEDRVGFGGWPLLGLRSLIVVALAYGSDRFIESPVRYRKPVRGDYRLQRQFAVAAIVIIAGALALNLKDVETNLAGLDDEIGAAPLTADSSSLEVVVIGDPEGVEFARALGDENGINVAAAVAFECVPDPTATKCDNWQSEWTDLIGVHDPDVVLFSVTHWDLAELSDSVGSDLPTLTADEVLKLLGSGFDLLSTQAATITWRVGEQTLAEAIQRQDSPFNQAMQIAGQERSDFRLLPDSLSPEETASSLERFRRTSIDTGPRVLVVGDSVSLTVGYGLEQWAVSSGQAVVWSAGAKGCGIARGGVKYDATGREDSPSEVCETVDDRWVDQVETFDPDIVIVSAGGEDTRSRQLPGWNEALRLGDPTFDDYLLAQYQDAVDKLTVGGARIIWMTSPCVVDRLGLFNEADGTNAFDPERLAHFNTAIIEQLAAQNDSVSVFDLDAVLCPDGKFVSDLPGVSGVRPDGVHFSPQGSEWFAEKYGDELLALGRPA